MKKPRNPYGNTKKRKAALAFLASRGITQVKALYPRVNDINETVVSWGGWMPEPFKKKELARPV